METVNCKLLSKLVAMTSNCRYSKCIRALFQPLIHNRFTLLWPGKATLYPEYYFWQPHIRNCRLFVLGIRPGLQEAVLHYGKKLYTDKRKQALLHR